MPTKVTDVILPTTMIGSYPKPRWFEKYNVEGRDLLEWWKLEENFQAWKDATNAVITDQEDAGLDIVTDGQMSRATSPISARRRGCTTGAAPRSPAR